MLNINSTKTYKETKEAVKALVIAKGVDEILNADFNRLGDEGHGSANIHKAFNYFCYSPKAAKYRS